MSPPPSEGGDRWFESTCADHYKNRWDDDGLPVQGPAFKTGEPRTFGYPWYRYPPIVASAFAFSGQQDEPQGFVITPSKRALVQIQPGPPSWAGSSAVEHLGNPIPATAFVLPFESARRGRFRRIACS